MSTLPRRSRRRLDELVRHGYDDLFRNSTFLARCTFTRLLYEVRARSSLLVPIGDHELLARVVRALGLLARCRRRFVHPPEDWPGGEGNVYALLQSLAEHLLGQYSVPRVLAMVWLEPDSDASREAREWFIAHANGQRIRSIPGVPIRLTRRMERILIASPHDMPIRKAMRRAEVLGLGGEPELVDAILASRLGERFEDGTYWRGVIQWLIHHWESLRVTDVDPIVDFVRHQRQADLRRRAVARRRTAVATTPIEAGRSEFDLRGRTPESLARLMRDGTTCPRKSRASRTRWPPSGIRAAEFVEELTAAEGGDAVWELVELLDGAALTREGALMRHCVGTYVYWCLEGHSSIWSLRRRAAGEEGESRCTIEVDPRRRRIVQVRAYCNRAPNAKVVGYVRRWAELADLEYRTLVMRPPSPARSQLPPGQG